MIIVFFKLTLLHSIDTSLDFIFFFCFALVFFSRLKKKLGWHSIELSLLSSVL
jgi:hypothetical protein